MKSEKIDFRALYMKAVYDYSVLKVNNQELGEAQAKRIEELESQLNRAKKALEPFAKQLAWKFGKYVGDLPIVAKSPHEEVEDEMTFKLHDFRMAHLIWEDISNE